MNDWRGGTPWPPLLAKPSTFEHKIPTVKFLQKLIVVGEGVATECHPYNLRSCLS
jgi:hypothetical protein